MEQDNKKQAAFDPLDMNNYKIEKLPKMEKSTFEKWMARVGGPLAIVAFILVYWVVDIPFIDNLRQSDFIPTEEVVVAEPAAAVAEPVEAVAEGVTAEAEEATVQLSEAETEPTPNVVPAVVEKKAAKPDESIKKAVKFIEDNGWDDFTRANYAIFSMLVLVGAIKMSDRISKEMLGL